MIRPTRRAVLIFLAGIPLALLTVIYDPGLWTFSFDYAAFVLLAALSDVALAFPPRLLDVKLQIPDKLYIGENAALTVTIQPTRLRRGARFHITAEQRGETEPAAVVAADLEAGQGARIALPVVPKRRGQVHIVQIWMRWRGPLGLVEFIRRIRADRTIDVLPNVRGVQGAALQLFAQEALFGIKTQQQSGEGAEFDALREYSPGLDSRSIDWKHSARHRKLLCKEFKTERNHHIIMAFDTGYLMLEPVDALTRLDHAINAGLMLAWVSLPRISPPARRGCDARAICRRGAGRDRARFPAGAQHRVRAAGAHGRALSRCAEPWVADRPDQSLPADKETRSDMTTLELASGGTGAVVGRSRNERPATSM